MLTSRLAICGLILSLLIMPARAALAFNQTNFESRNESTVSHSGGFQEFNRTRVTQFNGTLPRQNSFHQFTRPMNFNNHNNFHNQPGQFHNSPHEQSFGPNHGGSHSRVGMTSHSGRRH